MADTNKPIVRLRLSERTVLRTTRETGKQSPVTIYTVRAKARHESLRIGDCTVGRRDPSICHPMHVRWIGAAPTYAGHIDIDLIDYDWRTKTQTITSHKAICYGDNRRAGRGSAASRRLRLRGSARAPSPGPAPLKCQSLHLNLRRPCFGRPQVAKSDDFFKKIWDFRPDPPDSADPRLLS